MLFMVVEHFKNGDSVPIYRRFRDEGRLTPAGVTYVGSWVTADLSRCFQILESPDRALLVQWLARWTDLVDFEVVQMIASADAVSMITSRL